MPSPDPVLEACQVDRDCVLAIRIDQCCPCPYPAARSLVDADSGLRLYEPGMNYAPFLPDACAEVACSPCPPLPDGVICIENRCQSVP